MCGYGDKVCLLLSALADCLLARRNYTGQKLVHLEEPSVDTDEGHAIDVADEEVGSID